MPTAPTSTSELLGLIRNSGLLSPDQISAYEPIFNSLPENPTAAAAELVRLNILTRFQTQLLLAGKYKGFRLGSYVIRELLGRGGMGAVYLAEHVDLKRQVALKVLVASTDADQKLAQDRFLREARAAAALDHPNIVRIHDVARQGETHYLVMEYVNGENLQTKLDRDGPLHYTQAVECIAQAAAGLQHAHEKGFVHRDIKPANLMLDVSGTIKILDMGLARSYERNEDNLTEVMDHGAIVGTADFISPEQALNNPVDIRADIYSLGATFYALVSGRPPFDGNTTQKLLQHQLKAPPALTSLNRDLPIGLVEVINRMMAKKREDRYTTPAEVIAALQPWLPASHRVLTGLSHTRLAQHADVQLALQQHAGRGSSSLRLAAIAYAEAPPPTSNSGLLTDTADGIRAVATATSTRPSKASLATGLRPATARKRRPVLIAAVVLFAVVSGVVLAVLSQKSSATGPMAVNTDVSPSDPQDQSPVPPPSSVISPTPISTPTPTPTPTPTLPDPSAPVVRLPLIPATMARRPTAEPPLTEPKLIHRFDAAEVPPFKASYAGGRYADGMKPNLPPGINIYVWLNRCEADFSVETIDGAPTFTIINHVGPPAAQFNFDVEQARPGFHFKPGTHYKVKFEYRVDGTGHCALTCQTVTGRLILPSWVYQKTRGKWVQDEFEFRAGLDPLCITFDNRSVGIQNCTYLRYLEVYELPGPSAEAVAEPLKVLELPKSGQLPFSYVYEVNSKRNNNMNSVATSKAGPGQPPWGWNGRSLVDGAQIEFFYDAAKEAFGIRSQSGPGGAAFVSPPFNTSTGVALVRFEYASTTGEGLARLRIRPVEGGMRDIMPIPPTAGAWKTVEAVIPFLACSAGMIEFQNNDPNPQASLLIRAAEVVELPSSAALTRMVGPRLYALDLSTTQPFVSGIVGPNRAEQIQTQLPKAVKIRPSGRKPQCEFNCELIDGRPALTMANGSPESSAIYIFDVEITGGARMSIGRDYFVRLTYKTLNDAKGWFTVGNINPYDVPLAGKWLPKTDGQWATFEVAFTKQEQPVTVNIWNRGPKGSEHKIAIQAVELYELK